MQSSSENYEWKSGEVREGREKTLKGQYRPEEVREQSRQIPGEVCARQREQLVQRP